MALERSVLTENIRRFRERLSTNAGESESGTLRNMIAAAERELALFEAATKGVALPGDDISESERATARQRLIDWFQTNYADSPKLAALIDPAPGLAMVEVNRTYELATGMSRGQIVGRLLFDLFPDNPNDPGADGVHRLYESLRMVAQSGLEEPMGIQRYDTRNVTGQWTARYWRPVNSPLTDEEGRLVFLLHVVEEIGK